MKLAQVEEFFESITSGSVSTIVTLIVSHIADNFMVDTDANTIGLVAGCVLNFILQRRTFSFGEKINVHLLIRYFTAEFIIIGMSQLLFVIYHKNRKWYRHHIYQKIISHLPKSIRNEKYLNTSARVLISVFIFITISFPLRKFWVFS